MRGKLHGCVLLRDAKSSDDAGIFSFVVYHHKKSITCQCMLAQDLICLWQKGLVGMQLRNTSVCLCVLRFGRLQLFYQFGGGEAVFVGISGSVLHEFRPCTY